MFLIDMEFTPKLVWILSFSGPHLRLFKISKFHIFEISKFQDVKISKVQKVWCTHVPKIPILRFPKIIVFQDVPIYFLIFFEVSWPSQS